MWLKCQKVRDINVMVLVGKSQENANTPADLQAELQYNQRHINDFGVFLNEAINQLSIAYLHQKQIETNTKISHDKYTEELQRVKMYIADNNVYGIDLNPTAVELAEISLG